VELSVPRAATTAWQERLNGLFRRETGAPPPQSSLTLVPPHIYALLRIAYGAIGIAGLLGVADPAFWRVEELVASQGLLHRLAARTGSPDWAGATIFWLGLLSYAAMTAGVRSRTATGVAYLVAVVQPHWNLLPLSSAFQAHRAGLFCLMWTDSGAAWSFDARHRRGSAPGQPMWPLRLLRLQVALIYFWSGTTKLLNASWRDGSAISYILANEQFQRFPWMPPASLDETLAALTYVTVWWELSFPLLMLNRHSRRAALGIGILMHAGMAAMLELGLFSLVMLASYIAFLDPGRVAQPFTAPRAPAARREPVRASDRA
jgi:uncharacterized membrane protein YphA (DoxX/SURF4 family)